MNNLYVAQRYRAVIKMMTVGLGVLCYLILCDVIGTELSLITSFLLFLYPLGIVVMFEILADNVVDWKQTADPMLKIMMAKVYYALFLLALMIALSYLFTWLFLYFFSL